MIKLVVFDIDGVLTDGTYSVDSNGNESKKILFQDLDSFNLIKQNNWLTMLLTSEQNQISKHFNKKFCPDIFIDGAKDKFKELNKYINKKGIDLLEVCYIGDGKKDIQCIESCGLTICPSNAVDEIKERADIILDVAGGSGVVYKVYQLLKSPCDESKYDNSSLVTFDQYFSDQELILKDFRNNKDLKNNIQIAVNEIRDSINKKGKICIISDEKSKFSSQCLCSALMDKCKVNIDVLKDNNFIKYQKFSSNNDIIFLVINDYDISNMKFDISKIKSKIIIISSNNNIKNINDNNIFIKIPNIKKEIISDYQFMLIHCICNCLESR